MRVHRIILILGLAAIVGHTADAQTLRLPPIDPESERPAVPATRVDAALALEMPELTATAALGLEPSRPASEELLPPPGDGQLESALTVAELEQLALANNPAVAQQEASLRALRGRWVQVGLPPNPTIGYVGEEIGDDGTAGMQGGFVGQQFITGGKLRLNRAVVAREIQQAEQRLAAMRFRVQTDVVQAAYGALIAQRRLELAEELVQLDTQAAQASEELLAAEEIPRAGLLQTQVELHSARILSQSAENQLQAAWRTLSAVVGVDLPVQQLAGDVDQLPELVAWDEQLGRITRSSPEVAAALAELDRSIAALRRARVEPVPDVSTQAMVQYDNVMKQTVAGVQVGIPLPIWNRNQGGIRQAEAEVVEARRNAARVQLDLQRRLAAVYEDYATARSQAEIYRTEILPNAQETFELAQRGYRMGEVGYLDFLTAQRTYSQTNLAYLDALGTLWQSWAQIEGMLLDDSLGTPAE